ncbi:MAG: hypothetical protein A3F31_04115 [Candidatus Levybacteria bacterium RIFCSPHIGHO2_12_FULL_38_12]|nr:MAG: hypothetical protein A3F31_04115 [Candidatus Levybacteria bacterium RIFCSPHIGHO2_12_FULL_38_12]OGH34382.1 MAG: hypothetical protein A3A47_04510 [Candidatus Levybacteria bacterium RIFCSPLOWO2_01_FULL_37_20]OGH44433.1 MAG: hypothetical protein A3J14_03200 [Candidatus Levybacteria bacterium RIFCSPLOWO2_02_FULL_37_18]
MNLKKILAFIYTNYLLSLFALILVFVGIAILFKVILFKPVYLYAKIKVGDYLTGESVVKPKLWLAFALKKGDVEKPLIGKPTAELLGFTYYPLEKGKGLDIYLNVKLKTSLNKQIHKYSFKRSTIAIGSPIDIEFTSTQITGTIIGLSEKEFKETYVDKIIYLVFQGGYGKDHPYRYDNIKTGEKYYDGQNYVFEVLDKQLQKNIWSVVNNLNAQIYEREVETTQDIIVKAKIKAKKINDQLFYGEEYPIYVNAHIPFLTSNFTFENFVIRKIE